MDQTIESTTLKRQTRSYLRHQCKIPESTEQQTTRATPMALVP